MGKTIQELGLEVWSRQMYQAMYPASASASMAVNTRRLVFGIGLGREESSLV